MADQLTVHLDNFQSSLHCSHWSSQWPVDLCRLDSNSNRELNLVFPHHLLVCIFALCLCSVLLASCYYFVNTQCDGKTCHTKAVTCSLDTSLLFSFSYRLLSYLSYFKHNWVAHSLFVKLTFFYLKIHKLAIRSAHI